MVAQAVPRRRRRNRVLPDSRHDGRTVAMHDPNDVFAVDDLAILLDAVINPALADPDRSRLRSTRCGRVRSSRAVPGGPGRARRSRRPQRTPRHRGRRPHHPDRQRDLAKAVAERVSDVHFEPTPTGCGSGSAWTECCMTPPRRRSGAPPHVSRLKIMAGIDIARTRLPQDGRFSAPSTNVRSMCEWRRCRPFSGRPRFSACSTRPAASSSSTSSVSPPTSSSGTGRDQPPTARSSPADPRGRERPRRSTRPCSKSTATARTSSRSRIPSSTGSKASSRCRCRRSGLTFPPALRSILRSDPDVILVGEIRDLETARIAAEASLTGHLVFSTIHTTSAAAVPLRLIDMGVEPFLVTSALTAVVGQRLVRRLCQCAELTTPTRQRGPVRAPRGAARQGRDPPGGRLLALHPHRVLRKDRDLRDHGHEPDICRLVAARADRRDIERWAVSEGMDTLRMAALRRVADGALSIEELRRPSSERSHDGGGARMSQLTWRREHSASRPRASRRLGLDLVESPAQDRVVGSPPQWRRRG